MTNFDRAVKTLDAQGAYCGQCSREPGDSLDACRDCAAVLESYAHALEAAGLLAPDLPEPGNNHSPSWGVVHFDKEKQVIKIGINGVLARTPEVAREWAYGLLAAANYAEKEQGNDQLR